MKFIEFSIYTKNENRDIILGIFYDYNLFETEEISKNIVNELNKDEKSWDFFELENSDLKEDELILKSYPENEEKALLLKDELEKNNLGKCIIKIKDDEDFANNWKKYYKPVELGEKIAIVPEWEEYENKDRLIIKINPGMAFGTGTHETTSLCIEELEEYVKKDDIVFDIGCGSGILGICAVLLGAKKSVLVDIDEKAIEASFENARLNDVEDYLEIKKGNLLDTLSGTCDLIVSNIIAEVIVDEIKNMKNHLKNGGIFISSGIIKDRKDMVIKALEESNFKVIKIKEKNNWYVIVGKLNV